MTWYRSRLNYILYVRRLRQCIGVFLGPVNAPQLPHLLVTIPRRDEMAMTQRVRRWATLPDDDGGNSLPFHLDEQGNSSLSLAVSNKYLQNKNKWSPLFEGKMLNPTTSSKSVSTFLGKYWPYSNPSQYSHSFLLSSSSLYLHTCHSLQ